MIQFDFGRLEQVELRTVWVSEDSDFAAWISRSDSLALLGETLNLELELENMEGWVTPSPRGVVCRTRGGGGYVVRISWSTPTKVIWGNSSPMRPN